MCEQSSKKSVFLFFYFVFYCSINPSINTRESSNDFINLAISFISSFQINEVNVFPSLTAPFPRIFLSNLFISFEVKFLTNPDKLSLAKGKAMFVCAFFPKLPNQEPIDSSERIILDI